MNKIDCINALITTFRVSQPFGALLELLLRKPLVTHEVIRQEVELVTEAKVLMYRLRVVLDEHSIELQNQKAVGWWLNPPEKQKIKELVELQIGESYELVGSDQCN